MKIMWPVVTLMLVASGCANDSASPARDAAWVAADSHATRIISLIGTRVVVEKPAK